MPNREQLPFPIMLLLQNVELIKISYVFQPSSVTIYKTKKNYKPLDHLSKVLPFSQNTKYKGSRKKNRTISIETMSRSPDSRISNNISSKAKQQLRLSGIWPSILF